MLKPPHTCRFRPYMVAMAPWFALFANLLVAGCDGPGSSSDMERDAVAADNSNTTVSATPEPMLPAASDGTAAPPDPKVLVFQVDFTIFQARVPKGVFSESGRIWTHLDAEAIPAQQAMLLQKNGIRVARGSAVAWMPIKAILDDQEQAVESSHASMRVGNAMPLTLELDRLRHDQTLFFYRPSGHLAGATFPGSRNVLRITYEIPSDRPSDLVLKVVPEIRLSDAHRQRPRTVQELIEIPTEPPARTLWELAFDVRLAAEEFVVIGPSPAAHQGHLPGSLMLCEEEEGRRLESIYVITPRVVATESGLFPR